MLMTGHLPEVYVDFRTTYPAVSDALDHLARAVDESGPLDRRTQRLVKLGMAVVAHSQGGVRSNVRKALEAGASSAEIEQVILLSLTTAGFPTVIAAWQWAQDVLEES